MLARTNESSLTLAFADSRYELFLGESSYEFVDLPKARYDTLDVLLSVVYK